MAARTNRIKHDPKTIEKIRSSQILNRLIDHVLGENEMTSSQVSAGLGLIKKILPDLAAVQQEISGPDGSPIDMKWTVEVVESKGEK
jgi:hypothetical protein